MDSNCVYCVACKQNINITKYSDTCKLCEFLLKLIKNCTHQNQFQIYQSDTNNDLILLHHIIDSKIELNEESAKIRGLIIDKNGTIVCPSLSSPVEEVSLDNFPSNLTDDLIRSSKIYLDQEGAIVRLYCYNDKWHLSTGKRLDAFQSHWGCDYTSTTYNNIANAMSFGNLFDLAMLKYLKFDSNKGKEEFIDDFISTLDKNLIYMFLIRNDKYSKNINDPPTPTEESMYYIGAFNIKGEKLEEPSSLINPSIPKQQTVEIKSQIDLIKLVKELNPYKYSGIVIEATINEFKRYIKIFNPEYHQLLSIRNGNPNLLAVYLELRYKRTTSEASAKQPQNLISFKKLYEKTNINTDLIEQTIDKIYKQLLDITKKREKQIYCPVSHNLHYAWKVLTNDGNNCERNLNDCHNLLDSESILLFNLIKQFNKSYNNHCSL